MPSYVRTCPYCDALQSPEARFCQSCGKPLPQDSPAQVYAPTPAPTAPSSPAPPEVLAYARSYRKPATEPLLALGALAALFFLGGAIAAAVSGVSSYLYASGLIGATFLVTFLYFWLLGWSNRRRGKEFLQSGRPLVAWVYTPEEWQQVRQYFYERMRSDSPPYGCLPILFSGTGLLVGVLVGMTDSRSLDEAIISVLLGTLTGAAVGGILILPTFLTNRSTIENMRHPTPPACVALGRNELFYDRVYLDTRIHPLDKIAVKRQPLPHLEVIQRYAGGRTHRLSIAYHFPSIILLPPRMVSVVEEAIPQIATDGRASASEDFYD